MTHFKKIWIHCICLLTAGALSFSLLTACGSENTDFPLSSAEPSSQNEIPVEPPSATEPEIEEIPVVEPSDEELVPIRDYIPTIYVDLKYATEDNFTGTVIYDFTEPLLRYGTLKKLSTVQDTLLAQGYSLLIWDAYRPVSAQFKLWEICPDGNFVSDPNKGYSSHSRGNTVDITLVTEGGAPVEMPTGFDDFTAMADRDYSDISEPALSYVTLLENVMQEAGFKGYSKEWWHYSDTTKYEVVEE